MPRAIDEKNLQNFSKELVENRIPYMAHQSMAQKTTFSIGGKAALFIEPITETQLVKLFASLKEYELPFYILGRGSNVLFPDEDFDAVVIHLGRNFSEMKALENGFFTSQSGALLADFTRFTGKSGYSGLEFAYGIPGTVGGGIYMNAGAYGGEMKDVLSRVRYMTLQGEIKELHRTPSKEPDENFSYRHSFFTDANEVILEGEFQLVEGNVAEILEEMDGYMVARNTKQPLEFPSAGSVFKRPLKGYASALIDECGLKGTSVGGAQVSDKHAGFIVNRGGATAEEILKLVENIQKTVLQKTNILLECELRTVTPINPW